VEFLFDALAGCAAAPRLFSRTHHVFNSTYTCSSTVENSNEVRFVALLLFARCMSCEGSRWGIREPARSVTERGVIERRSSKRSAPVMVVSIASHEYLNMFCHDCLLLLFFRFRIQKHIDVYFCRRACLVTQS